MSIRPNIAWHYTCGTCLPGIIADEHIIPATAGVPKGEIPAVWFSLNQRWEETADKALMNLGGGCEPLGMMGTFRHAEGLFRFGVPAVSLCGWPRLARMVRMSSKMQKAMEATAYNRGAKPSEWMGTTTIVPVAECIIQRMNEEFEWVDFDLSDFVPLPLDSEGEIAMSQELQDMVRRSVPASEVSFEDGEMLLSPMGVVALADEVISGRKPGNVELALSIKSKLLQQFPPS